MSTGRRSLRARVALDLAPIHAGRGGAGGGIWSHAAALVRHLDLLAPPDLELVVLARDGQALPDGLRNVRVERVAADLPGTVDRMRWIHAGLPALCRRLGVDVLHKLATEAPAWLPSRTRLVVTVHDFMPQFYRETIRAGRAASGMRLGHPLHGAYFELMTRRVFARADAVITVSEAVADEARRRHPRTRARIVTVRNGVEPFEAGDGHHDLHRDLQRDRQRDAASLHDAAPDGVFELLTVGVFLPHKGQLDVVRALARLGARHPGVAERVRLTIRGHVADPAYHAAVRAAAVPLGERVRFVGYDPAASIPSLYRGADLLVQLPASEGFGLPLVEAQMAGVPVLCSDLPVLREVLGDGARFVRREDADAVADAVAGLIGDARTRGELVARGRENARRFDWGRAAEGTVEVYRAAASGAPAAR